MAKIIAKRKPAKKVQPAKPAALMGPIGKQGVQAAPLPKKVLAKLQAQVKSPKPKARKRKK